MCTCAASPACNSAANAKTCVPNSQGSPPTSLGSRWQPFSLTVGSAQVGQFDVGRVRGGRVGGIQPGRLGQHGVPHYLILRLLGVGLAGLAWLLSACGGQRLGRHVLQASRRQWEAAAAGRQGSCPHNRQAAATAPVGRRRIRRQGGACVHADVPLLLELLFQCVLCRAWRVLKHSIRCSACGALHTFHSLLHRVQTLSSASIGELDCLAAVAHCQSGENGC